MKTDKSKKPIILFDGLCNLCSATVQFVIKHDRNSIFQFGSLQSEAGIKLANKYNLNASDLKTFILIENNKSFTRSTAALRVARNLNGLWKLIYGLIIVPRFIRDFVYNYISKKRYVWFGKREVCWVPNDEYQDRFIDGL